MVEQICPRCKEGNPLDNAYCGRCGAGLGDKRLEDQLSARRGNDLTVGSSRWLPAQSLQQVGRAVAVSLVALAAEAGLAWLRRRLERPERVAAAGDEAARGEAARGDVEKRRPRVTILSRRVLRVWQHGRLVSQAVEDSVWQVEE